MTQKEREDRFIEQCRKNFGSLSYESELLLRYGYAAGATELGRIAYAHGKQVQRDNVLVALGSVAATKDDPQ